MALGIACAGTGLKVCIDEFLCVIYLGFTTLKDHFTHLLQPTIWAWHGTEHSMCWDRTEGRDRTNFVWRRTQFMWIYLIWSWLFTIDRNQTNFVTMENVPLVKLLQNMTLQELAEWPCKHFDENKWADSWDMVLFLLCKLILQMHMHSHPVGLDVWYLVGPFVYSHISCVWTAKVLARLHGCAGSPEP